MENIRFFFISYPLLFYKANNLGPFQGVCIWGMAQVFIRNQIVIMTDIEEVLT